MSSQIKEFYEAVSRSESLQKQVEAIQHEMAERLAVLARDNGFAVKPEDLWGDPELSESDLDQVAGGQNLGGGWFSIRGGGGAGRVSGEGEPGRPWLRPGGA